MSLNTDALADSKALRTLAAEFPLAGCELHTEIGIDGVTRLHAVHRGKVEHLDGLDEARTFLALIGGPSP